MDTELTVALPIILAVVLIASVSAGLAMRKNARQQYYSQREVGRRDVGYWGRDEEQDPYYRQEPAPRRMPSVGNGIAAAAKVIAAAAVVFVIIVILAAVMHAQNGWPGSSEPQNPVPPEQTSHPRPQVRPSESPAESAASEELVFTVDKMLFARHNGNLKYMEMAGNGLLNCCVYVNAENPTEKTIDLTGYEMVLTCGGTRYQPFLSDDPAFLSAHPSVAPGETLKLKVVDFQVPAEQQYADSAVVFTVISPGGTEASWTLR